MNVDPATDTATAELRLGRCAGGLRRGADRRSGGRARPPILNEIGIEPGLTYSAAAIDEARDALVAVGLFSGVEIVEVPQAPGGEDAAAGRGVVDLSVHLEEGDMQRLKLGVGVATEQERQQAR
ncbi:MAG: hypothetical protein M0C28_11235 [Candidatus Moduliflexus flocculans]|nr:hypothetical protein [Candidatus Moduliflexus flocculans]